LSEAEVLARAGASREGLTRLEAHRRLLEHGPNALPAAASPGWFAIALRQLRSPLIYVLLVAAVVSVALGDFTDAAFIAVVLALNTAIGGAQEWRAERQNQSLQKLLRVRATVVRERDALELDAEQIVPGDIVALESGQRVPADLRLLSAQALEVAEAALTGESLPVLKDASWQGNASVALPDRRNMAHAGSTVTRGRGLGVVVATGLQTAIGQLASTMASTPAGKPPLILRMERFSRAIALIVLAAVVLIGTVGVLVYQEGVATMFLFGVALAVSAIPEGLPVALTVALAIAARRMAGRGAVVRRLPAVEGLGSCSLIASDKTGTLTCNELTVRELWLPDGTIGTVTGAGYAPLGGILEPPAAPASFAASARRVLEIAVACNEADLHHRDGTWSWRGDPTDIALLALAGKRGLTRERLLLDYPQVNQIPYEPERRFAGSFHAREGGTWVAVKGAPERVLPMCRTAPVDEVMRAAEDLAERGFRVLALACGTLSHATAARETTAEPQGLKFAGLVGLIDPLRPGVREAVERCRAAGIRVLMVTGDHPVTALAIARELGIASRREDVIQGDALSAGSAEAFLEAVTRGRVFARVTPDQKLLLVEAAQRAGHFVAVTGDGVNDAPALRRANIGVAMGRSGTDVAREASDLVLSDDNFATIVAGVEEGRIAYQNVRNVVYLLTAAGAAEVLTVGIAVMLGMPIPLLPVQLLWLNLVTNGIQDVALAFERGHGDELAAPPRRPQDPIFDRLMIERALLAGSWMALLGFGTFAVLLATNAPVEHARNMLLLLMVLMQNVDALNARSETRSVFAIPLRNNPLLIAGIAVALAIQVLAMNLPLLQNVLRLEPVAPAEWLALPLLALSLLAVMELHKRIASRRASRSHTANA
jgi:magnesium-transporting ATPase (P-type)